MRKTVILLCLALTFQAQFLFGQKTDWTIVPGKITTEWADQLNPTNVLQEYPRPYLVRGNWLNLNGLWEYTVTPQGAAQPTTFDGKILVPFAIESALSGVGKTVGPDSVLWYNTSFSVPKSRRGDRTILHFGAVDWQAEVYVNDKLVGSHQGGFDPFYFDVSDFLKSGKQKLSVKVWDPTDEGPQPRGKQIRNPHGIWYTPVTGIWQTVWLESVPETHIVSTKHTPDIDNELVYLTIDVKNAKIGDRVKISVSDGQQIVKVQEAIIGETTSVKITQPKLWSPDNPFLYDLDIELLRKGKAVDKVKSYFAMRKISMTTDENGIQRMMLNNEFVFQYGPLDQGWWPDGLYTAPSDEALKFDIVKTKEMGFNMIRKHIKVEPARWYYHCDQVGMLVWQDMPSGDMGNSWNPKPGVFGLGTEKERTPESEAYFRKEWNAIMETLHNFASIVVWVPFNEAWGQFKTEEITAWTEKKDPSRLVNSASGGNFFPVGHIIDIHNYPDPAMPHPDLFGAARVLTLGEFGGLGLPVTGHVWQQKDNWGYQSFKTEEELTKAYTSLINRIPALIEAGLSAAVYTQTTDVEIEINGLLTYDRKVMKIPSPKLKALHQQLYNQNLVKFRSN